MFLDVERNKKLHYLGWIAGSTGSEAGLGVLAGVVIEGLEEVPSPQTGRVTRQSLEASRTMTSPHRSYRLGDICVCSAAIRPVKWTTSFERPG